MSKLETVFIKHGGGRQRINAADFDDVEHELWVEHSPDATDAAAALADQEGIDLAGVTGTGSGGRITKGDVEAFLHGEES